MESERSKTMMRSGNSEKKLRIGLTEEYNKLLSEMEIECQNKLERETIEFILQKTKEFAAKSQVSFYSCLLSCLFPSLFLILTVVDIYVWI